MSEVDPPEFTASSVPRIRRYSLILALLHTFLIGGSALWSFFHYQEEMAGIAFTEARAYFNRDLALRKWGSTHGGVYVPVTSRTPPNPFLSHVPERDISSPSGRRLTLMNPAYMVRQLNEDFSQNYGIGGHITSLRPLRPENAPDPWEKTALEKFENGITEFHQFTEIDGKPYLRLMKPILVEKPCLKCHAQQGYALGDIRGGVGVSLPMTILNEYRLHNQRASLLGHALIWLCGLLGLFFSRGKLIRYEAARIGAEVRLKESEARHRLIVENQADLILKCDADWQITFASPSCLSTFPWHQEELLGKNFFALVHKDDQERIRASLQEVFVPPHLATHEEQIQTARGWRWFHWSAKAYTDEQGKVRKIVSVGRDITQRKNLEAEREKLIAELTHALEKVKVLSGMLPICASCKKIRDDKGYWQQIETYIHAHSDATFTHGICPDCAQKELDKLERYKI